MQVTSIIPVPELFRLYFFFILYHLYLVERTVHLHKLHWVILKLRFC